MRRICYANRPFPVQKRKLHILKIKIIFGSMSLVSSLLRSFKKLFPVNVCLFVSYFVFFFAFTSSAGVRY